MERHILMEDYAYELPEERIARFPLEERSASKLLVWRAGAIAERRFADLGEVLPEGQLLVFNNTKVIRARIVMHKPSGARIEVFCLEPREPADYERAFAARGECLWSCIVGNLKKWKEGAVRIRFTLDGREELVEAEIAERGAREQLVRFRWTADRTFGELLEHLGRIPIPPYLGRESEAIDDTRYQTVYSRFEGSVAAPTAGLHFTPELIGTLRGSGIRTEEVTLHVGAGTFLPVKADDPLQHTMHTEHFEVTTGTVRRLTEAMAGRHVVAVGTTSVRTLESLAVLGWRILRDGTPHADTPVGQWEAYDIPAAATGAQLLDALASYMESAGAERLRAATQIMIMPGFTYRVTSGLITNFHQPKSTLLLLVSAFIGEEWRRLYDHALSHGFRFLSYGDSSLLLP